MAIQYGLSTGNWVGASEVEEPTNGRGLIISRNEEADLEARLSEPAEPRADLQVSHRSRDDYRANQWSREASSGSRSAP